MSDDRTPEEIQRDIEETRRKLAEDLDELSFRVSPEGLRDRAETGLEDLKETALGATQDALRGITERTEAAGESFSARLRARPLPLSVLGAAFGVGWLLVSAAKQGSRDRRAAPVLPPTSPEGTGRLVNAAGEVVHEPEHKPDWLTSSDYGKPATQTLLISAVALASGAAVGALLPDRETLKQQVVSRPQPAKRTERVPVVPPPVVPPVAAGSAARASVTGASSPSEVGSREVEEGSSLSPDEVFRSHYETAFASSGRDYSYFEPAYLYGAGLPSAPMHRSRSWDEAEADAQRDWERNHSEAWDDVRDAVRQGWERGLGDRQT